MKGIWAYVPNGLARKEPVAMAWVGLRTRLIASFASLAVLFSIHAPPDMLYANRFAEANRRGAISQQMFEQTFKNIDDVLWKEAGCATELDYTEQTSWILFLKYLDDLEKANEQKAELQGKKYETIIDAKYRWSVWAARKKKDGSFDHDKALTGDDLIKYVDEKLFRYLKGSGRAPKLQALAGGTTVPFIQMADLRRLLIPVPPIDTQREIVQQQIEQIKTLRQQIKKIETDISERELDLSKLFFRKS